MSQQTALIIGASRGLGLGLARALAGRGWRVTATTRRPVALSDESIAEVPLDVRDEAQLEALYNRLHPESLDLLLVNAIAPVHMARRLLPKMKTGGLIAFMSSKMGSVAQNQSGDWELYRASKAALNSLVRGFHAREARPLSIRVLTLHPGWVRTDMGGPEAPLSVAESVTGLIDVIERHRDAEHRFLDHAGSTVAW